MKRFIPDFVCIAIAALLVVWGLFMGAAHAAEPCLPIEAGGIGTEYTRVDHADHHVVIRTFMCGDRPTWVFERYERPPSEPASAKELAALLNRLRLTEPSKPNRLVYEDLAREQLRFYKPAEAFKQRKVRNI